MQKYAQFVSKFLQSLPKCGSVSYLVARWMLECAGLHAPISYHTSMEVCTQRAVHICCAAKTNGPTFVQQRAEPIFIRASQGVLGSRCLAQKVQILTSSVCPYQVDIRKPQHAYLQSAGQDNIRSSRQQCISNQWNAKEQEACPPTQNSKTKGRRIRTLLALEAIYGLQG
jgi:hypothetical protein